MATPTTEETSVGLGEPRSRSELVLEMIALRHQIAVLKRSRTRRPCFGLWDRLFWILLSWRWPRWPESLMIVQPETVKRWRRNGWSGLWRYRSGGRWRGGRPRVSREVRELISGMGRSYDAEHIAIDSPSGEWPEAGARNQYRKGTEPFPNGEQAAIFNRIERFDRYLRCP